MHFASRSALVACIAILTATAACGGDSTGPGTTSNLASHFDTLYVDAKALSASDANYDFRTVALSDLELPAAFGASPTTIAVTTATGTESWKGFVFEEVLTNNGTPADSGRFLLAYRDADAHTLVVTVLRANNSSAGTLHDERYRRRGRELQIGIHLANGHRRRVRDSTLRAHESRHHDSLAGDVSLGDFPCDAHAQLPRVGRRGPGAHRVFFPLTTFAGERFQDPIGASNFPLSAVSERSGVACRTESRAHANGRVPSPCPRVWRV